MKNYDERIESIFRKYDEKLEAKRRKNAVIRRIAFSISGLCAAVIIAVLALKMPNKNDFNPLEVIVTPTTSVEATNSTTSDNSSYMNATTKVSGSNITNKTTSVTHTTSKASSQTDKTSSGKITEKTTSVKTNTTTKVTSPHTTEAGTAVPPTTTTKAPYISTTTWEETAIDKFIKQKSAMYKPFELDNVINETDLVFSGTVIDRKEYNIKWIDENGENWGPYRNSIIEVKVNDVYYGQTDKETIKIYYPESLTTLQSGAFLIKDDQEYIFRANAFDDDYYAKKANNPFDRFEQEKYADIYITNSRDGIMPVINDVVSVYNGFFENDENAFSKALSKDEVTDSIPDEANKANWFMFFRKDDVTELLRELFNR